MLQILSAVGGIILVDLALSGDNALVIGAAAAGLPRRQRRQAIVLGGGGAIVLRVLLGIAATLLLQLPLLQALGGAALLVVAVRLLAGRHPDTLGASAPQADQATAQRTSSRGLLSALLTILVADVTMSLDNVLAVGALAAGNVPLLASGLLLSMAILLLGSALVARLIEWLPWLVDVAALVLAWTAAQMVLHDPRMELVLAHVPWPQIASPAVSCALVLAADLFLRRRAARRTRQASADKGDSPPPTTDNTGSARPEEADALPG